MSKVVKEPLNHIPEIMIGYAQNSLKYTRTKYPYITGSGHYVNPILGPKVIELCIPDYLLRGGYYNMYIFRCLACATCTN